MTLGVTLTSEYESKCQNGKSNLDVTLDLECGS